MRTFGWAELWFIVEAAKWTLALSVIAFAGGTVVGLLVALARTGGNALLARIATVFTQIFQGTPLLLQLFLVFFGAPILGFEINPWIAAAAALILNSDLEARVYQSAGLDRTRGIVMVTGGRYKTETDQTGKLLDTVQAFAISQPADAKITAGAAPTGAAQPANSVLSLPTLRSLSEHIASQRTK